MSEWSLFNAKWCIFQLYHGNTKLNDDVRFLLDQNALKLHARHVDPLEHIILILSQPVFVLIP